MAVLLDRLGDPLLGVAEFSEEDLEELLEKLAPTPKEEPGDAKDRNDGDFRP